MASSRRRRRMVHHAAIALGALAAAGLVSAWIGPMQLRARVSTITAYLGLGGIALSLMLGPFRVLLRRPNPVSSDLRRDVGIWAALLSLAHVAVGLTVHMRGRMEQYFLPSPGTRSILPVRIDPFGVANHLGLVSGLILLILLLLSSDLALRRLGSARWKRWQRWNYVAGGTMALHGVIYQLIEKQRIRFVILLWLVLAVVVLVQLMGVRAQRARLDILSVRPSPNG